MWGHSGYIYKGRRYDYVVKRHYYYYDYVDAQP
jgi:hypothetical protein